MGRSCSGLKASSPACWEPCSYTRPWEWQSCACMAVLCAFFPAFAGGDSLGCRYLGLCSGTGFCFGVAVLKSELCKKNKPSCSITTLISWHL